MNMIARMAVLFQNQKIFSVKIQSMYIIPIIKLQIGIFWNVGINEFGMFLEQFGNIFVTIYTSQHKCSRSFIIYCIQFNV